MLTKNKKNSTLITALAGFVLSAPPTHAQASEGMHLRASNFSQAARSGFGDRNNRWEQSMVFWKDNLYVGTSRQSICTSLFDIYQVAVGYFGKPFADACLFYPPPDPDILCALDGADLSLQVENWPFAPKTNVWQRVFQSPATLDNPGTGAPAPPRVGKKLPYEISIRGSTIPGRS